MVLGRLSDRTARNGEDMMRILADYLSRYELLTPEKTGSVLKEVKGHSMFLIQLPLQDGRPGGTVSDDTSNWSVH